MYFLTTVMLPLEEDRVYEEYRRGAAFDRKTGEVIPNCDLFACSPEAAKREILNWGSEEDPKEMETAFHWEDVVFFPEHMELNFQQGTLPSQENSYIVSRDYVNGVSELLHPWAVPGNN